jgi:3D-(3,5/4)-trihydroxycyclohexane-1,2-dione acylhydrolase (decyclizing)
MRLTVAQALVRFLANQYSERDGVEQRLIPGMWGIFGHGNVAGLGQALLQYSQEMPYSVSKYFDRISRPEQLIPAALAAMRVLTDPVETGAVTLCLPQDVQAEAYDWPEDFFRHRVWRVGRPVPEVPALDRAAALLRNAKNPLIVAGGGVVYSEAEQELRAFAEATGIPVADTHAGKGAVQWDHPCAVGGLGSTGTSAANTIAAEADVVLGIGTRYSDFTTASHTIFGNPTFVNLNVTRLDAAKHSAEMLLADAKLGIQALHDKLRGWQVDDAYRARVWMLAEDWNRKADECFRLGHGPLPAQTEILGALNESLDDRDVVINAAGSMPGDLQMLWRARDPKAYNVEYAYSCMGYEVAAGVGTKLAAPDREVVVLVGDGSYLMMAQEIVTMVAEGLKVIIVLVQNHGFASIGALSESLGSQRFGTRYRYRGDETGLLDGTTLPVDLAANAESLGATVLRASTVDDFRAAIAQAKRNTTTTVVHVETDLYGPNPPGSAWWDVPVSQVSELDSTRKAFENYSASKRNQKHYL